MTQDDLDRDWLAEQEALSSTTDTTEESEVKRTPAQELTIALNAAGAKARFLAADEPDFPSDGVNIWPLKEPGNRYPYTTIYAPNAAEPEWVWGPNFEHRAPGDVDLDTLVRAVVATVPEVSER